MGIEKHKKTKCLITKYLRAKGERKKKVKNKPNKNKKKKAHSG